MIKQMCSALVLACVLAVCLSGTLPVAPAAAEAVAGPEPVAGPAGLPDGRLYEQVSPAFKNGNFYDALSQITFGLVSSDGNAALYPMSGPVGKAYTGLIDEYVSRRIPGEGWQTEAATPRQTSRAEVADAPLAMIPAASFDKFVFLSLAPFVAEDPLSVAGSGVNIFLTEDPAVEPTWVGRPLTSNPLPAVGAVGKREYAITGVSPDLDTIYFAYNGTLTPQDASREPYVKPGYRGSSVPATRLDTPWGFYEWSADGLVSAGELPGGGLSPFGAVPAALAGLGDINRSGKGLQAHAVDNEVSEDGNRAFFVSPDPAASTVSDPEVCAQEPPCTSEAPELYVREPGPSGAKVSALISRSQLPGDEGKAAPDGVVSIPGAYGRAEGAGTDAYPTPDGTHVFFASVDQLTSDAPGGAAVKTYEYDLETKTLTYLPGVSGGIVAVADDGSELLFEERGSEPWKLELWQAGANGGSVTDIGALPEISIEGGVDAAHFNRDGSAVVFRTSAHIPGGFNNGGQYAEVYRYDVSEAKLSCLSCAPQGMEDLGNARMSYNNAEEGKANGSNADPLTTIETRGISEDGDRVFFDTPNPLVLQDTNSMRDVYEWENGTIYLISSGSAVEESMYLDSGASGENVFFATSAGLVPGDTDEAYDVYDARIPRPGDNAPPSAVPCQGAVCQGPPSVPQLLSPPASEAFSGPGNPRPAAPSKPAKPRRQKAHRSHRHRARHKHKHGKHKHRKHKRHEGKRDRRHRTRERQAAHSKGHHDGRGK